ncbi:MAG: glutamine synthetase, partial [Rhizobiales bacterium]|nr:glutamine synthetase [Hyphomicrobiales bacterium]
EATQEDLSLLSVKALSERGYVRLPQTLEAALQRFEGNATVCGWFPEGFADVYVKHKKGEIAYLSGKTQAEICAAYESVY